MNSTLFIYSSHQKLIQPKSTSYSCYTQMNYWPNFLRMISLFISTHDSPWNFTHTNLPKIPPVDSPQHLLQHCSQTICNPFWLLLQYLKILIKTLTSIDRHYSHDNFLHISHLRLIIHPLQIYAYHPHQKRPNKNLHKYRPHNTYTQTIYRNPISRQPSRLSQNPNPSFNPLQSIQNHSNNTNLLARLHKLSYSVPHYLNWPSISYTAARTPSSI